MPNSVSSTTVMKEDPIQGPVWTGVDFGGPGLQTDFVRVPYSSDKSAYGWIPVPIICVSNGGGGPTALLTAGTHGDEYEGQIALRRLIHELPTTRLEGRVIILPALNQPAVKAGRRNSPLDGGNLNRLFPGSLTDGPTAAIAYFVAHVLFPIVDLVIDLHSGGTSLDYLPMALAHAGRGPAESESIRRLLKSFGAPFSAITNGSGGGGKSTLYAAAEQRGIAAITTELGGGPTLSEVGLSIAEKGIRRVLRDFGIAPDLGDDPNPTTRFARSLGPNHTIYAPCDGLFEPLVRPGDKVAKGQKAGFVYRTDDMVAKPCVLEFSTDGIVAFRRFPTMTETGDALFGLISETENDRPSHASKF